MRIKVPKCVLALTIFCRSTCARPQTPNSSDPLTSTQLIVRQVDTKPGEYSTITAALNAISDNESAQNILIYPGFYREQVYIRHKHPLVIRGYSENPNDYRSNQVKIINAKSASQAGSNAKSSTVLVEMNQFSMYNIDIVNNYGVGTGTQALALSVKGLRNAFYGCSFDSFQDTLRSYLGTHLFSRCYITGAVDFFFGVDARSWVAHSTLAIKGSLHGGETITASRRKSPEGLGFIVFDHANVISAGAAPSSASLGRPWGNYSRVMFQFSYLSEVIGPAGWSAWNPPPDTRLEHADFEEFQNTGPGAVRNHSLGHIASRPATIEDILGLDVMSWTDSNYVSK